MYGDKIKMINELNKTLQKVQEYKKKEKKTIIISYSIKGSSQMHLEVVEDGQHTSV